MMLSCRMMTIQKQFAAVFHNLAGSRKVYIAGQSKIQTGNSSGCGQLPYLREATHESDNARGCNHPGTPVSRGVFI